MPRGSSKDEVSEEYTVSHLKYDVVTKVPKQLLPRLTASTYLERSEALKLLGRSRKYKRVIHTSVSRRRGTILSLAMKAQVPLPES